MPEVNGGRLMAQALRDQGVELLFGLFAGHLGPLFDACPDVGLRVVDVRHEEAAAHMAHAWARVTRQPGVAAVTAGPGVTNATTGVANAWVGCAPLLLIGGRWPGPQDDKGAFHEFDQLSLMRACTKWAATVREARRLPEYVAQALRTAGAGRPGPAFLDVPSDLFRESLDETQSWRPAPIATGGRPAGDPDLVRQALDLLTGATRPVVIVGSGVWWSAAEEALASFLAATGLPVLTTQAGRGLVPADHPQNVAAARSAALRGADVVLVIGARLNFVLGYGQAPRFAPEARFIQVDIDAAELGRNRDLAVGILGDAHAVLEQLTAAAAARRWPGRDGRWLGELQAKAAEARRRLAAEMASEARPIHPLRLCAELQAVLDRDATICADGGNILSYARVALDSYRPGRWLDSGTFGALGVGIPFANAAQLARPGRQVVALVGDGSFGFNALELDTAARHNLPIVVVVSNNGGWAIEAQTQRLEFGRTIAVDLPRRRLDHLAEALGCQVERVERPSELRAALERAFAAGRPALVDVLTDPAAASPDSVRGLGTVPREQPLQYQPGHS